MTRKLGKYLYVRLREDRERSSRHHTPEHALAAACTDVMRGVATPVAITSHDGTIDVRGDQLLSVVWSTIKEHAK